MTSRIVVAEDPANLLYAIAALRTLDARSPRRGAERDILVISNTAVPRERVLFYQMVQTVSRLHPFSRVLDLTAKDGPFWKWGESQNGPNPFAEELSGESPSEVLTSFNWYPIHRTIMLAFPQARQICYGDKGLVLEQHEGQPRYDEYIHSQPLVRQELAGRPAPAPFFLIHRDTVRTLFEELVQILPQDLRLRAQAWPVDATVLVTTARSEAGWTTPEKEVGFYVSLLKAQKKLAPVLVLKTHFRDKPEKRDALATAIRTHFPGLQLYVPDDDLQTLPVEILHLLRPIHSCIGTTSMAGTTLAYFHGIAALYDFPNRIVAEGFHETWQSKVLARRELCRGMIALFPHLQPSQCIAFQDSESRPHIVRIPAQTGETVTAVHPEPVSRKFGFDRGTPIDRILMERFLREHGACIRGRVLEVGDPSYTKKFGLAVEQSDVLHFTAGNPQATLIGNLETGEGIPENAFDCIICTQTLQFVEHFHSATRTLYKALKPGGTLLATASGISQISRYDMDRWGEFWRFTDLSFRKVLQEVFGSNSISVETYGNVALAQAFLDGKAAEEIPAHLFWLDDPDYQIQIGIRAIKGAPIKEQALHLAAMESAKKPTKPQQSAHATAFGTHTPIPAVSVENLSPTILAYHRVWDKPVDTELLAVSPEHFEAQMQYLAEHRRVVPLLQFIAELEQGQVQPGTVAITFDDGYQDNLLSAMPILHRFNLPATFFVTTRYLDEGGIFWWDVLEALLFRSRKLPDPLPIQIGAEPLRSHTAEARISSWKRLSKVLRDADAPTHQKVVAALLPLVSEWDAMSFDYQTLTGGQVFRMAGRPGIEVGAHGPDHVRPKQQSPEVWRQAVQESKATLESISGKPCRIFAYAYGTQWDVPAHAPDIVRECGFLAGIANDQGECRNSADRFRIPRRLVRNWNHTEFQEWMRSQDRSRLESATVAGREQKLMATLEALLG